MLKVFGGTISQIMQISFALPMIPKWFWMALEFKEGAEEGIRTFAPFFPGLQTTHVRTRVRCPYFLKANLISLSRKHLVHFYVVTEK